MNELVANLRSLRSRAGGMPIQEYALGFVVVALFIAGAILKPETFPTWDNVRNILTQSSVIGVLAIGMTFVIATSGIDLSVGSMLAAAGMFGAVMVDPDGTTFTFMISVTMLVRISPSSAVSVAV